MSFVNSIFEFLRFNKRNWKAVVLCLFAATVFWFFNALNKNYSANINFPLAFDYNQERYVPVKPLPQHVRLNVSGMGWDLFRKSSGLKVPPLVIPLEKPSDVRKIVGSTLPALFSTQLSGLQINFSLTDTLYITMDERVRMRVTLAVDSIEQFLANNVGVVGEVTLVPDTVWVEGPKSIVRNFSPVVGVPLPRKNIDQSFNEEVELIFPNNELIQRNPFVTQITFTVEELIEVNDMVTLQVVNVPKNVKPVIENSQVSCTYRLPESLVKTLSIDSLVAWIDLQGLERGNHRLVPVITGLPQQARLVRADSVQVKF